MGWLGNTPKLNRYQSLIDICTVEKKVFSIDIKCDALIDKTEERDGKNCLDLRVVNKENTNISEIEVCESSKVLDISSPVLDTDMKVPMHMVFEYTYLPPLFYGISNISMELMEDKEISNLMVALNKVDINIANIRLQHIVDREKRGYSYYESDKFLEGITLGLITFVHTKVNKISIDNENIVLDASISINGVMRETQIRVKEFEYQTNDLSSVPINIFINNISDLDISKSYDLRFVYLPKSTNINEGIIDTYCINNVIIWKPICYNKENLENFILDKSIEEYIDNSFEKLMFTTLFENE